MKRASVLMTVFAVAGLAFLPGPLFAQETGAPSETMPMDIAIAGP